MILLKWKKVNKAMKKSVLILFAVCAVAISGAFQQTKPPGGQYQLEQSDQAVQSQLGYTGSFKQVGSVPLDTNTDRQQVSTRGSQDAATTMRLAQERASARTNMATAAKRESDSKSGKNGSSWFSGLLFLVLGFAAIVGAMKWADKNLPAAPKMKKAK